jgi:predicted transcriptional regulator of viral defense system
VDGRSDTRERDRRIAALATRQRGLIERWQLLALGLGTAGIDDWVARGRLHVIYRGVYALGHRALPRGAEWLAAVMSCGSGAVLSHRSAADLWELRSSSLSCIDVTVPVTTGRRSRGRIRLHRTRTLVPDQVVRLDGIPVTSIARTLVDLAEVVPPRALERVVDQAEALRRFDLASVRAVIDANPERSGCRRIARLLDAHAIGTTLTRSGLEEAFLAICGRAGVPGPLVNQRIAGLEVDFLWPEHRLVAETDSVRYHSTRRAFERDRERDALLLTHGFRVVRFTERRYAAAATRSSRAAGGACRTNSGGAMAR